jgi:ABC-type polysaccharide/polyol phosphate transport system ATPase subunit
MALEEIVSPVSEAPQPEVQARPIAIEVRDVVKEFRIPLQRVDSIKERVLHPLASTQTRSLLALDDVSFDVHRGEFFGIVGRNGTGKSTLLKILASIYRADGGTIRMAGRVAPFIELGVGFNMELTARENIVLNGVMVGLSRDDAEARIDSVIEFAELEEFAELKLKNYSSGMLVRLAFSVMIQSDADVLLIDEVLAVGDAAFQQKCKDVFHEMRGSERTVVLVTHDMSAVEQFCHRAILLDDGHIAAMGDPEEIADRYLRLNFAEPTRVSADQHPVVPEGAEMLMLDAWLESDGERTTNVEAGKPLELHARFQAVTEITGPSFGFVFHNAEKVEIGGFHAMLPDSEIGDRVPAGEEVHVRATLANRFTAGRYVVQCWVHQNHSLAEPLIALPRVLDFVVYASQSKVGVVSIMDEVEVRLGDDPGVAG